MKQLSIPLLLTILTTLSAESNLSIDQQIAAMRQATPQERVTLMNQFKQQLATMNAQERAKSISQLREKMQQKSAQEEQTMHNKVQQDQMQQSEKIQRMEQMQQQHGGDQYMHQMGKGTQEMGDTMPVKPPQHP